MFLAQLWRIQPHSQFKRIAYRLLFTVKSLGLDELASIGENIEKIADNALISSVVAGPSSDTQCLSLIRRLHVERRPELAYSLISAKQWENSVDSVIHYRLAMNLLLECGHYNQVVKMWRKFRLESIENLGQKKSAPRSLLILYAGASYKLNTPEACADLLRQLVELTNDQQQPHRRAWAFAIALAIHQNRLDEALSLLSDLKHTHPEDTMLISLHVMAFVRSEQYDKALIELHSLLTFDSPAHSWRKRAVCDTALDELYHGLKNCPNAPLLVEFCRLQEMLTKCSNRVRNSIDRLLFVPIDICPSNEQTNNDLPSEDKSRYMDALMDRITKRISEHGPLQIERYQP